MKFNLVDALFRNTPNRRDQVAIVAAGQALTHGDLRSRINQASHWLRSEGLKPEQRVILIMKDSPELVIAFLAVVQAGGVAIPLNPWASQEEYSFYFDDSRAGFAITDPDIKVQIPDNCRRLNTERLDSPDLSSNFGEVTTVADDVAFWLYSSGSTGRPKAVVHSQNDLIVSCETYAREILQLQPGDILFSTAKMFFAYGLGNSLAFPIYFGASVVLEPERVTAEIARHIFEQHKPTLFFSFPSFYSRLLSEPQPLRLDSLRLCLSAGEHLPVELFKKWKETMGREIIDGIGTTEMTHIFISNRPSNCKPGSSGRKVPGYEARVVNDLGNRLPPYEIGNLMVSGESAAMCYWHNRERTREIFQGRWVLTGDKYYVDDEGYYYFSGRGDDLFKVDGSWVIPREVENALLTHKAVKEAAVVGARDEQGLIKPQAYVVLKEGEITEGMDLRLSQHLKHQLRGYMIPRSYRFVTDLPRTFNGKVQRFKLREE
ncbi:MAG TPA: benzoate-CoA ligase family protein [Acidobacteriota bacterium]|jgi:benzoate-CoA ligase